MPVYDYKCSDCNSAFSVLVLAQTKEEVRCPHCGGHNLKPATTADSQSKTETVPVRCG